MAVIIFFILVIVYVLFMYTINRLSRFKKEQEKEQEKEEKVWEKIYEINRWCEKEWKRLMGVYLDYGLEWTEKIIPQYGFGHSFDTAERMGWIKATENLDKNGITKSYTIQITPAGLEVLKKGFIPYNEKTISECPIYKAR
jgi:hypothetical protein